MENNTDNTKQNKFEKNQKYYTISIYATCTIVLSAVAIKFLLNYASTINILENIFSVLAPYIIGVFIAYLLNPLVKRIDRSIYQFLHIKSKRIRIVFSILFSYLIVFGIIVACIIFIIPQIYDSLKTIYIGTQSSYDKLIAFLNKLSEKHPEFDLGYITTVLESNSTTIINFIKGSLDTILPFLYNTSVSVISWTINIIIAIIVSVYMLIDKNRLITNFRRAVFAFMKKEKAESFLSTLGECNYIFSRFVIGKTIDSTIIGFMCFGLMKIIGLNYTVLISVIVGITNMIPYFGPFIGAVPGVIILLTVNFKSALIFAILILALQQFDGLYLGPKILGSSTGLRPLWIIFAITLGGWLAGPIGMFLGVPCVAVIAFLIDRKISHRLTARQISPDKYTLQQDYFIPDHVKNGKPSVKSDKAKEP